MDKDGKCWTNSHDWHKDKQLSKQANRQTDFLCKSAGNMCPAKAQLRFKSQNISYYWQQNRKPQTIETLNDKMVRDYSKQNKQRTIPEVLKKCLWCVRHWYHPARTWVRLQSSLLRSHRSQKDTKPGDTSFLQQSERVISEWFSLTFLYILQYWLDAFYINDMTCGLVIRPLNPSQRADSFTFAVSAPSVTVYSQCCYFLLQGIIKVC